MIKLLYNCKNVLEKFTRVLEALVLFENILTSLVVWRHLNMYLDVHTYPLGK